MQKKKLTPLQIVGHVLHTAILGVLAVVMAVLLFAANVILPGYARMVNAMLGYKKSWDNSKVQTDGLNLDYNTSDYTADNIGAAEADLTDRINSEGVVLLKNDGGLPLAEGTTVSLFSANSNQNAGAGLLGGGTPLNTALASHGLNVNETLWNFYSAGAGAGYGLASGSISFGDAEDFRINECPLSVLQSESGLLDSVQGTTPVYVLKRVAGEGRDMPRSMYNHADTQEDKVRSYLEPDTTEREILQYLNDNYDNTVLIINSNAALELDWLADYPNIKSVLYAPTIGASMADILTGKVSPSGRTVDTFAADASASPAAQNFGDYAYYDENGNITKYNYVTYEEGIYVGYRYYETRYEDTVLGQGNAGDYDYAKEVIYPFGYGLSYTTFAYSDLKADADKVTFTITNTGSRAGAEIAQLYVAKADAAVFRPEKELKGFAKVFLQAGECKTVTIPLDDKAFRYWNVKTDRWETEGGSYQLLVGASVQDIRLRAEVPVQGTGAPDPYAGKAVQCYRTADIKNVPDAAFEALLGHAIPEDKPHIDQTMTLGELNHSRSPLCWLAWAVLHTLLKRSSREGTPDLNLLFQYNMPVRALAQMTGGMVGQETVDGIVMEAKGFWIIGLLRALIGFGQNAVSNRRFRAALDAERGGPAV